MKKTIDGMLENLDPWTIYIPESEVEDYRERAITGNYGGIGATIRKVDEYVVKPSYLLKGNECITVDEIIADDNSVYIKKENIPINIIYEDDDLIVVNKPSGLVVHPGAGNKEGTLLNGLLYHFEKLSNVNLSRPGIVHRLDKNTSGIILVAKTDEAHYLLSEQFINRTIKKTYRAIVWGDTPEDGKIEGYIMRDPKKRTQFKMNNIKGRNGIICNTYW